MSFSGIASSSSPRRDARIMRQPDHKTLSATKLASKGSSQGSAKYAASATPIATPKDEITSDNKCWPSASSAADFKRRPARIKTKHHAAFSAPAAILMPRPSEICSKTRGLRKARYACQKIAIAASTIRTPSITALINSAL